MSKTLTEIAALLKASDKKVQLIYAFNGTGKTRLSRVFKELIAPKNTEDENDEGWSDLRGEALRNIQPVLGSGWRHQEHFQPPARSGRIPL